MMDSAAHDEARRMREREKMRRLEPPRRLNVLGWLLLIWLALTVLTAIVGALK